MVGQNGSPITLLPALHLMEKRAAEDIGKHPWIQQMEEIDIPARDKLIAWLPSITVFSMNFKDYCNIILKYPANEAKIHPLKATINEHATEDGTHWRWLMTDLETLNANVTLDAVSFFKNFWSKDVQMPRRVFYDLVVLAHEAKDPILRYCLITAFEQVGNVEFTAMTAVADKFEAETGKQLLYIGQHHLDHEKGHLENSQHKINEEEFWNQEVDADTLTEALRIVNRVFDISVELNSGFLAFLGENAKKNIYMNKE